MEGNALNVINPVAFALSLPRWYQWYVASTIVFVLFWSVNHVLREANSLAHDIAHGEGFSSPRSPLFLDGEVDGLSFSGSCNFLINEIVLFCKNKI